MVGSIKHLPQPVCSPKINLTPSHHPSAMFREEQNVGSYVFPHPGIRMEARVCMGMLPKTDFISMTLAAKVKCSKVFKWEPTPYTLQIGQYSVPSCLRYFNMIKSSANIRCDIPSILLAALKDVKVACKSITSWSTVRRQVFDGLEDFIRVRNVG
ncbi:hypothetical protein CASFOL_032613 [Castilleja foliolosa]|uniref:Uncharacterized protein n=1 Tax=Castilleja foliolosa TaxID=1961234 RepID=A0ABD3C2K6_9LAMI